MSSSRGPWIHWTSPNSDINVTTPEVLFLSKTFSASMQPSITVPFFYRATGSSGFDFEANNVMITTLITADRFPVFKRLVDAYTGACFFLLIFLSPSLSFSPSYSLIRETLTDGLLPLPSPDIHDDSHSPLPCPLSCSFCTPCTPPRLPFSSPSMCT
ncbi:hypothetical protein FIBSPDRAFT_878905 [Athelia psychrophila]|uniref:Uncharacterized protein n=1 Tax=Athelia psychrophila TaxID=1759441 RepID=A0A167UL57_9AGAM|nr:hypothetical protein FIBSPDRAFT_878905 [Fibularhizoctonia sp. CBS 109695]